MPHAFTATEATHDGYPALRLATPDGSVAAKYCPELGMIGCSLEHAGEELLGQRGGLARYEESGSTMGIPLLHPWANRLSRVAYSFRGREVKIDPSSPLVRIDSATRLPIHGLLAASPFWTDVATAADPEHAELSARLPFGAHPELLQMFPFPHDVRIKVVLDHDALTATTAISPTAETAVPISFGFHPYLKLPGVARRDWRIDLPVARRLVLDEHMIPAGETEPAHVAAGPLGDRTFDDGFCDLPQPAVFSVAGGGRRVDVEFGSGYLIAQVYAPRDEDVICFEPMAARTNALVDNGPALPVAEPGETYEATFRIRIRAAD